MNFSRNTVRKILAGAKVADLCRKHGISEATFYN
ncbi:transposase, partial [Rhizobium ruizarguesonis]